MAGVAALKPAQLWQIALGFFGLMFCWGMKNVYTTPIFRDRYGVSASDVGYIWIAGPISGLVVQPVVGVISDASRKRSVYFLSGLLIMAVAVALLPNGVHVASWLGSKSSSFALALAVMALWALDLAMNACLVAVRAIIADSAPVKQQADANTILTVAYGGGTLCGYVVGALDLAQLLGLSSVVSNVSLLFYVSAAVLLLTGAVTFRQAVFLEQQRALLQHASPPPSWHPVDSELPLEVDCSNGSQHGRGNHNGRNGRGGGWRAVVEMVGFWRLPPWLRPVCVLLFFSWVGWYAVIVLGSDWVGTDVFGGDPNAPEGSSLYEAYADGVSWSSVGLAVQAGVVLCMGCGPVQGLLGRAGLRISFALAIAVQAALTLGACAVGGGSTGKALSIVVLGGLGVPLALIETLPYMVVGLYGAASTNGQLLGKLNVYIVLAELALLLCIEPVITYLSSNDTAVFWIGGLAVLVGLVPGYLIQSGPVGDASPPSPEERLLEHATLSDD